MCVSTVLLAVPSNFMMGCMYMVGSVLEAKKNVGLAPQKAFKKTFTAFLVTVVFLALTTVYIASMQNVYGQQVIYSNNFYLPPNSTVRLQIKLNPLDGIVGTLKSLAICTREFCIDVVGIVLDPNNYPVAVFRINATKMQTTFYFETMDGGNYTIILMNLISYEAYVNLELQRVKGLTVAMPQVLIPTTTVTATTTQTVMSVTTLLLPTTITSTERLLILQPTTVTATQCTPTTIQQISIFTTTATTTITEMVTAPQQTVTKVATETATTTATITIQGPTITVPTATGAEKASQETQYAVYALAGIVIVVVAVALYIVYRMVMPKAKKSA